MDQVLGFVQLEKRMCPLEVGVATVARMLDEALGVLYWFHD
jgi:hypothetical protein